MTTGFESQPPMLVWVHRRSVSGLHRCIRRSMARKDRSAYYVASPLGVFYIAWYPSRRPLGGRIRECNFGA